MLLKQLLSKCHRRKQTGQGICATKGKCVTQAPEQQAAFDIVEQINSKVGMLLPTTIALDWTEKDEELAVFHRNEIRKGKRLGSGAFSDVYAVKAFCPSACEDGLNASQSPIRNALASEPHKFAIKRLRSIFQDNPSKLSTVAADLVVEAHILALLRHQNILPIYGWSAGGTDAYAGGSIEGYFLIVQRLDETLDQRMERWRSEGISDKHLFHECTRIGSQIASALEYLHSKDFIFRDLKPNNIGFDASNNVKVFDFGLCRELPVGGAFNGAFKMSGRMGTLRYLSPECALSKHYGISSDVYSFSIVLYEMVSRGVKPFAELSREDFRRKVCLEGARPRIHDSWPPKVRQLLERSWSPDMTQRPTMADIVTCLTDMLEGSTTVVDESSSMLELYLGFSANKTGGHTVGSAASLSEFST